MSRLKDRIKALEDKHAIQSGSLSKTVIGFVSSDGGLVRSYSNHEGAWIPTAQEPTAFFPERLEPIFPRPKRFMVIIGGRGSGKSLGIGDYCLIEMHDFGNNSLCIREFQSSIEDSVHGLMKEEIKRLEMDGFTITDRRIKAATGAHAKFAGLSRNPESVKSAFGFKRFWVEEAQFLSSESLKILTPTARNKPIKGLPGSMKEVETDEIDLSAVSILFTANPSSSDAPFSQRFIVPFQTEIDRHGIYEDDLHLIIKINWNDNPWYSLSGLEDERKFDLKHLPRSTYDWIWEGGYNDEIENALIKPEWFDACIDAHEKLGLKPFGVKKVTHDPSDLGGDPKAVCVSQGNIIQDVIVRSDLDVNEGSDWALGVAINEKADIYEWDVGGMGVSLKRDVNAALEGTGIEAYQFNGSSSVDDPDSVYEPSGASNLRNEKTNKEICRNLRAQCYLATRDRVYRTYRAVVHGEMCDPELLVSFSSKCQSLNTLKTELCKMPIKPNSSGLFELYTKKEMREKFKVRSPNAADVVMMRERKHSKLKIVDIPVEDVAIPSVNYW